MSQSKIGKNYGWKKSSSSHDDRPMHHFAVSRVQQAIPKVDLRPLMPPVYDQGNLGSCTANAIACAYQFDEIKEQEKSVFVPSRLGIYYCEREKEGTVDEDAGAEIYDGMAVIHSIGVFPETEVTGMTGLTPDAVWPYVETNFAAKPPPSCFTLATRHKSVNYRKVKQDLQQLKQALIAGFPVVFGFNVYDDFESDTMAQNGLLPMPGSGATSIGGHAVVIVGYDDTQVINGVTGAFIVRNSWGPNWGLAGYFYMPYAYATNPDLANDFWTLTLVADQD